MSAPPARPRKSAPDLSVTVRGSLALVRGPEAQRATGIVCGPGMPVWSPSGQGWVVPARYAHDLMAWAQSCDRLAVFSEEPAAGGAA